MTNTLVPELLKEYGDACVDCYVWGATEVNDARRTNAYNAILQATLNPILRERNRPAIRKALVAALEGP